MLRAVRQLRCHATADEIYRFVAEEYPSVGKATVYRNLKVLSESGVIRRLQIPGEPDRFDHNAQAHHHIRCVGCGRIFDVTLGRLPDLTGAIRDTQDVEVFDFDVIFRGICPACRKQ